MKKVTIPTEMQDVDWSKPQWVIYEDDIVLTTGRHNGNKFTGTCLPCSNYPNGEFDTNWSKDLFKRLDTDIPFTISNSNE